MRYTASAIRKEMPSTGHFRRQMTPRCWATSTARQGSGTTTGPPRTAYPWPMASATLALAPRRATPALVLVAFNAIVLALVLAGYGTVGIALVVAVPALLAIIQRPQRGLLLLAALAPFSGLLLIVPTPWFAKGWKEALTALTLGATFIAPARARGAPGRRLPGWAPAVAGLGVLGLTSAVAIGGLQAAVGLKVGFFYVL